MILNFEGGLWFSYFNIFIFSYYAEINARRHLDRGGGAVGLSVRPASEMLAVGIQAATDLIKKKQVVTAPLLNARQ